MIPGTVLQLQIDGLTACFDLEDGTPDPNYLIGTARILGGWFHFEAVRVETVDGRQAACGMTAEGLDCGDDSEPQKKLARLEEMEDAVGFATCQLPGREGDWVIWIVPHLD